MDLHDISQSVLKKIQQEDIKPHSSWYFWSRNAAFWLIFLLSALIGGRAFGVILRFVEVSELDFAWRAPGSVIRPVLMIIPLFWLVSFLFLILLSSYGLHHTKKGYKFPTWQLIGLNLLVSLIIGVGSFHIGDAHRFEEAVHRQAPFFSRSDDISREMWAESKEGRLSGMIIIFIDQDHFSLLDPHQQQWVVDISQAVDRDDLKLKPKMPVRMVGQEIREGEFRAEIIRPQKPRRRLLDFLDEE